MKKIMSANLFTLLAIFSSCGKEVKNSGTSLTVQRAELTASTISLNVSSDASSALVRVPQDAWVRIPETLKSQNLEASYFGKLYFNTNIQSEYGMYCVYKPTSNAFQFEGCYEDVDQDGIPDLISYFPGEEVAIDENNFIKLEIISEETLSHPNIRADIEVDWL